MRLDKFIVSTGKLSRSESGRAARAGRILVNGVAVKKADTAVDPETDVIVLDGEALTYRRYTYILLNKPDGYVSATEDGRDPTVLTLLPDELQRIGLFPCGRLDKHTTGLMLLTNNGELSHRLLAPARHVDKTYAVSVKFPLSEEDGDALERGVDIGGYVTAPCRVERDTADDGICRSGRITLHEGKYHQIKLMMEARHNQITRLERLTFGPLSLDPTLAPGEWRWLTPDEVRALESAGE